MSNKTTISPEQLAGKIGIILDDYDNNIVIGIKDATKNAMSDLVKRSKADAPVGNRKRHYRSRITSQNISDTPTGRTDQWYVRKPDYRLTHLLNNGHRTRSGGQWPGTHFLDNAMDAVVSDYEKAILKVIK